MFVYTLGRFDIEGKVGGAKVNTSDWEMIAHFVDLLEDWCKDTEK